MGKIASGFSISTYRTLSSVQQLGAKLRRLKVHIRLSQIAFRVRDDAEERPAYAHIVRRRRKHTASVSGEDGLLLQVAGWQLAVIAETNSSDAG